MVEIPAVADEPGQLEFMFPVSWFVYVGSERHQWRFVYHCAAAHDGDKAIEDAMKEAIEMGITPAETYMAVPTPAIYTVAIREQEDS